MKVLLLSAYAARSHEHWQRCLESMFAQWQWRVLSLPPRHFSWRVRGNALYWSMVEREALEAGYDLLVATSMVDLATLRGLVPALTRLPTVVYFHENQFEYPQYRQQHGLLEAQMTTMYTALAADQIVFNSHYNQDSFVAGCATLLARMPDRVPPEVVPVLQARSTVLPVPIDSTGHESVVPHWPSLIQQSGSRPLRLLWVGRFEHDKGGESLLRILQGLEQQGLDFELAVTGQQFRQCPAVFNEIETVFARRLVQFGYVDCTSDYHALLRAADIVLSTALHEFQGLAVMEAVACNCLPVVPDRLVYREIYPAQFRYDSCLDDPAKETASAVTLILQVARDQRDCCAIPPDMSAFTMPRLMPLYAQCLQSTVAAHNSQ